MELSKMGFEIFKKFYEIYQNFKADDVMSHLNF
jgi:hypothetical protein